MSKQFYTWQRSDRGCRWFWMVQNQNWVRESLSWQMQIELGKEKILSHQRPSNYSLIHFYKRSASAQVDLLLTSVNNLTSLIIAAERSGRKLFIYGVDQNLTDIDICLPDLRWEGRRQSCFNRNGWILSPWAEDICWESQGQEEEEAPERKSCVH